MLSAETVPTFNRSVHIYGSCSATLAEIRKNSSLDASWLGSLEGGWALAVVDDQGEHQNTTLATDRWGTRPLYYAIKNEKLFFAEDPDALYLSVPQMTINEEALARFLMEDFSHPEETFLNEIKKLSPGSVLNYSRGVLTQAKWTKDQSFTQEPRDLQTIVTLWKKELLNHLTAILPLHQKWGIFVSGGLDSSGLVALCMDLIHKHKWPVQIELYNLTTDHPESLDQGFCQKLAEHYQLPLRTHQTSPQELKELYQKWKHQKSTLPFFPTFQMFEPLMQLARQNHCTGLFFGYGADEQWTLPAETLGLDFLAQRQWRHFFKNWRQSDNGFSHLVKMLKLWAQHQAPEIIKSLVHSFTSFGLHPHLRPQTLFKKQKKQLKKRIQTWVGSFRSFSQKQLFLRNFLSGNNSFNLSCHITLGRAYGLEVYFPYLSPDMLDISLQTTSELFLRAKDKQILRELLKDSLLEEIRAAPKFQDYCQLAFKTSLLLAQEDQSYLLRQKWIKPHREPRFDDDFFFETLFVEKFLKTAGATHP